MPEKLLRPADVAELLGVSYDCACQLMKSMRCVNLSRDPNAARPRWAVTVSEIDRWQKERTQRPDDYVAPPPQKKGRRARNVVAFDPNLWEMGPDGKPRIKRKRA